MVRSRRSGQGASAIDHSQAHLVGGGIASLAAAVLLIRDAGWEANRIHLYEAMALPGGSLDGSGATGGGFVIRGGRMFEAHFGRPDAFAGSTSRTQWLPSP